MLLGVDVHRPQVQLAYWINIYNPLTLKIVLDAYPVDSIRQIHEGVVPLTGPWHDLHANVAGQDLTLDQIEHGILRPIWRQADSLRGQLRRLRLPAIDREGPQRRQYRVAARSGCHGPT